MKRIKGAQTFVEMEQYELDGEIHTYHKFVRIIQSDKGPIKYSSYWEYGWATMKQAFDYFRINGMNLYNRRTF